MTKEDKAAVTDMMRTFYASPAVLSNGSEEIFHKDIENCVGNNPYVEGYIFEDNQHIQGYAMLAKSYSTEYAKACIWVEDLYVKPEFQGLGIGTDFLNYIQEIYPEALFRLEVDKENEKAIFVYKKCGYEELPYMEMKKI